MWRDDGKAVTGSRIVLQLDCRKTFALKFSGCAARNGWFHTSKATIKATLKDWKKWRK